MPIQRSNTIRRLLPILATCAALACIFWYCTETWFIRREFIANITSAQGASAWSIQWRKSPTAEFHGVWANLDPAGPDILEIEPSGKADLGKQYELALNSVKSGTGQWADLSSLTDPGKPDAPGWSVSTTGVVYQAQKPGRLRIPVRGPMVKVVFGRTSQSCRVTLRYKGEELTVDTRTVTTVQLPTNLGTAAAGDLRQTFPVYHLHEALLSWKSAPGQTVHLGDPLVRFSLFDLTLFERSFVMEPVAQAELASIGTWKATGEAPVLRCNADFKLGERVFVIGAFALTLLFAGVYAAARWAWSRREIVTLLMQTGYAPAVCVCIAVLGVNFAMAAFSPMLVSGDGKDYIESADSLVTNGNFERFPTYKAPGMGVLLAGVMKLGSDYLTNLGWVQAIFCVLTAWMTYSLVRSRASRNWALLAAFIVGVHPTLLVYQRYVLRENLSAALVTALALILVQVCSTPKREWTAWWWALALALVSAIGAYTRENLQPLVFVAPILLLIGSKVRWRVRVVQALMVFVVATGLLVPRLTVIYKRYGTFGVVGPKTQGNRALSVWNNALTDGNDTLLFTNDEYTSLRRDNFENRLSDYEVTSNRYLKGERIKSAGPMNQQHIQAWHGEFADEAVARRPFAAAWDSVLTFANQLGLWNVRNERMKNAAPSDEWWARPLCGEPSPPTNFQFDPRGITATVSLTQQPAKYGDLVGRVQRSIRHLEESPPAFLFKEWFFTFRAVRPVLAVLFLAGTWMALRRRDFAFAAAAGIVLASVIGAAVLVMKVEDRFGAPFIPIMVVMAIYAASSLWKARQAKKQRV